MKHDFESKNEWYDALLMIARTHDNGRAVRDFEGWTDNWKNETPAESYYAEFPEHEPTPNMSMTLQDKFAHLLSEPIYSFNPFGAMLVCECWMLTGGLVAMADKLPEGRKSLLLDLYESRAGAAHRNSPLDRT